jgi:hypothetical protein
MRPHRPQKSRLAFALDCARLGVHLIGLHTQIMV